MKLSNQVCEIKESCMDKIKENQMSEEIIGHIYDRINDIEKELLLLRDSLLKLEEVVKMSKEDSDLK
jgi:hypothetical protein